ncbi:hypothetical protein AAVH_16117 [Aphelenchoides avenae]|nr:hypothetical protein AAVH_16117 [Aphelenchus avenae]
MQRPQPTAPPEELLVDEEAHVPVYQPAAGLGGKMIVRIGVDNPRANEIKFFELQAKLPDQFATIIEVKNGNRCRVYEGYNDLGMSFKPLMEFNITGGPKGEMFTLPVSLRIDVDRTLTVSTKKSSYPGTMKTYHTKLSADV